MEKLPDPIQSRGALQKFEQPLNGGSQTKKVLEATAAMEKLLISYPDYGKAPKPYLLSIAEILSQLSDDVVKAALDLKTGVRSKCAYLPTVADIVKFAEEYIAARDQFKPPPRAGIHKLLEPSTEREPTAAERQRAKEHWQEVRREMTPKDTRLVMPPSLNEEETTDWLSKHLKTPPAPPSRELVELVRAQMERDPAAEKWV